MGTPVEAVETSAPIEIFVRCTENRVEDDYEGGLVLFQIIRGQRTDLAGELTDARLVLSAKTDAWLRQFPVTREEKQSRYFSITLREVPLEEVPPDPNAEPEFFDREGNRIDRNGMRIAPVAQPVTSAITAPAELPRPQEIASTVPSEVGKGNLGAP